MDYLKLRSFLSVFHYIPLHTSDIGRSLGYTEGQLPVTESISGRLLRLPLYFEITRSEQEEVVDCIFSFFNE
jgi:dTDP-4-amino-4,6-dideoxygalactose transaminase